LTLVFKIYPPSFIHQAENEAVFKEIAIDLMF
jgi:hypothetical protein